MLDGPSTALWMWQSDNNAQAVLPLSGLSSTITRVLCNTICNTELLIPLGWPVPAVVAVLMEVLSSPLFALIFLIHNTFPNRERTDSDRALCMRCENVHRPVSEWDFAFPLAHAQVSQCKRITLHTMSKLCMDLRLDRYNTGTELTG